MNQPQPFKLIIEDDEGRRSIVPVDLGDVTLGRHEGNVIRLKERNVSRRHARLVLEDDSRVFAYDLDSYNGLWANGDRINGRFELHQGDLLRIGDFQLELKGDSLRPRREEATQRTRLQDVAGAPALVAGAEHGPLEPTQVDGDVPPPPTESIENQMMSAEPTVTSVAASPEPFGRGPSLRAIMQEATALIRSPVGDSTPEVPPAALAPGLQPPFAKLLCLTTSLSGQEFLIDHTETVIGRTAENEIAIDHRSISRHHAKIRVINGRYSLVDLDSANGTLVNGEVYAQAELKRGDIVELGHVRLRFVPPGEVDTWSVDEQNHLARMQAQRRRRGALWRHSPIMMFLLVGSAILGLGAALTTSWAPRVLRFGQNPNTPGEYSAASVPIAQTPQPNDEALERLLVVARHAVGQHQFKKAASLAQDIVQIDAACAEAQAILQLCAMEKKSQSALDAANQAAQGSHWSDAYKALLDIPKDSSVYRQGQMLLGQIKPGLIEERLRDCRQAITKEDWDEAELLLEEVASLEPSRPELANLRASVRDGRGKHVGVAHANRTSAGAPSRGRKDKEKDVSRPVSNAGLSMQGSLGTPATALAPTSTQPANAAGPPAGPIPVASRPAQGRDPKAMYAEGTKLLAARQYSRAIDEFQKCITADKNFAMCYRALGIAYADANNGTEAVHYYRLYLKVDPSARDAAQVRTLLQQWDQSQAAQSATLP